MIFYKKLLLNNRLLFGVIISLVPIILLILIKLVYRNIDFYHISIFALIQLCCFFLIYKLFLYSLKNQLIEFRNRIKPIVKKHTIFNTDSNSSIFIETSKQIEDSYLQINKKIEKYKIILRLLKESEQRYKVLFNKSRNPIAILDIEKNIFVNINNAYTCNSGYTIQEMNDARSKGNAIPAIANDTLNKDYDIYSRRSNIKNEEFAFFHKNGNIRHVIINTERILINERPHIILQGYDLTEEKHTKTELYKAKQSLNFHTEQNQVGIFELDVNFRITKWNKACERIFGYAKDEMLGESGEKIIPEKNRDITQHIWNKLINKIDGDSAVDEGITKEGEVIICQWINTSLVNENGKFIGASTIVLDITEQKRVENELIIAKNKFKDLSNISAEGILIHENGIVMELNNSAEKILGFTKDDLVGQNIIDNVVNKEFRDLVYNNIKNRNTSAYEFLATKKDGTVIPLEVEPKVIKSDNSQRVVFFRDISSQKATQSEIKRLNTAIEQSANHIIITNQIGELTYANSNFYHATGYTKKDVIGQNMRFLKSDYHANDFYKTLWKTIKNGRIWKGDICNKKKNGELYWESVIITPVLEENRAPIYIAIKEDITEKRSIERRILSTVVKTEENERKHFAQNLHDELGPHLSSIRLYASELENQNLSADIKTKYAYIIDDLIKEAIEKTRSISNQLMPSVLTDYGLEKGLNSFCRRINTTNKIAINIDFNLKANSLEDTVEIIVYRMLTELINNTLKHSGASLITIKLDQLDDKTTVTYTDNGIGFDLEQQILKQSGLGLSNLLNRLKTIQSSYKFTSSKNKGIIFQFNIPFAKY